MPNIYSLSQINDSDLNKVGFRAWALSKAHQNKFSVPLSFIVPNHVFEEFLIQNRLNIEIRNILSGIQQENMADLKKEYQKIKELFEKAKIPDEFVEQLRDAYSSLAVPHDGGSANDFLKEEDATINFIISPEYRTSSDDTNGFIMNLKGFNSFLSGLKSAWLSLYSPEQIQFRIRRGIRDFNAGIIVQRMINADVSLEVFSKGPLGDYEIIVKSYFGLPDITRKISKDIHSVSKDYLKIESSKIARQEFKIVKGEKNSTLEKRNLGPRGEEQKLSDKEILDAARISKRMASILRNDFKAFFEEKKGNIWMILINLFPESALNESDTNITVSMAAGSEESMNDLDEQIERQSQENHVFEEDEVQIVNEEIEENMNEEIEEGTSFEETKEGTQVLEDDYIEIIEENKVIQEPENMEILEEKQSESDNYEVLKVHENEEEPLIEIYEQENKPIKSAQEILEEVEMEEIKELKNDSYSNALEDEELNREESEKKERDEALGDDDFIISDKEED